MTSAQIDVNIQGGANSNNDQQDGKMSLPRKGPGGGGGRGERKQRTTHPKDSSEGNNNNADSTERIDDGNALKSRKPKNHPRNSNRGDGETPTNDSHRDTSAVNTPPSTIRILKRREPSAPKASDSESTSMSTQQS
jgi:hypothetical protein